MSSLCPTCNRPRDEVPPTYPVTCPKCYQEYGPSSTVTSHVPDGEYCIRRQLELAKKYRTAFDELHVKYQLLNKQREDEQTRNSIELNRVLADNKLNADKIISNYELWIKSRSFNLLTKRVVAWGTKVLGTKLVESRWERAMRVLEEVIELAQAEKISPVDIAALVDYVYARPIGTIENEAGGVMVCMIAWAHAAKVDLELLLSGEVDRIE